MKAVVAGATGRIGSTSVTGPRDHGAQAVPLPLGAYRVASGCLRAKAAQQDLVHRSALPCSLVRGTPYFTSVQSAVHAGVGKDGVHLPPLLLRPVKADRVAARAAVQTGRGAPSYGPLIRIVNP
ncbi:hypothetical protein [Streptomyces sp. RP5T]|uniref:hypothetical protein n=1 Tax=Streptomyces sp. RP5T TaxID=2490848 RepID=UPI000F654D7F|nr:hypothetical protein [Streptomyces sp. RP5T]RRR87084.1 hypothetical protein EHS43_02040 [Streptomyces sp. RP5T]